MPVTDQEELVVLYDGPLVACIPRQWAFPFLKAD